MALSQTDILAQCRREDATALRLGVMDEDGWREQFRYDLAEIRRAGRKLKESRP